MSGTSKEVKAEKNRQAVKKCMENKDRINVILPKGTKERVQAYGFSVNSFARDLILQELDRLDKIKKIQN